MGAIIILSAKADQVKKMTNYEDATTSIQKLIDSTPTDGVWHEIDGYSICIEGDTAAIYLPGSTTEGECDLYVSLNSEGQA